MGVYTYEDVPKRRFTIAGQSYPQPSPYDRLILENLVRYQNEEVAIVAAETEEAADKALKLIKVDYEVLEPLLDFTQALDNDIVVHPEGDVTFMFPQGGDVPRNLVCSGTSDYGDLDEAFAQSDIVFERTYTSQATQTAPMETFRAFATTDAFGRISVTTSTQVPFTCAAWSRSRSTFRSRRCRSLSRASAAALAPSRRAAARSSCVRHPADRPSELLLLHPRGDHHCGQLAPPDADDR